MYYRFILSNNGNVATIGKYRYHSRFFVRVGHETTYRTRAIISRGWYIFYPISKDHLCTVTFGLMYGLYSRAASNQERPMMARVR